MALPTTSSLLIIGTGLLVLGLSWAGASWSRRHALRQLLADGLPAQATVLEVIREGDGERMTRLRLSFVPPGQTESLVLTRLYEGRLPLQAGQNVAIRHLARHPSVLVLVDHAAQRIT